MTVTHFIPAPSGLSFRKALFSFGSYYGAHGDYRAILAGIKGKVNNSLSDPTDLRNVARFTFTLPPDSAFLISALLLCKVAMLIDYAHWSS